MSTNVLEQKSQRLVSDRELDVLSLAARGYDIVQSAQELCISSQSVKNLRSNILSELNAHNITQAVVICLNAGWLTLPLKPLTDSKTMLTTSDAARLLNIHPNTVRRWGQKGLLRVYRIGSRGDRRFRWEDIIRLLRKGK